MQVKIFEVRDRMTLLPVVAVKMNAHQKDQIDWSKEEAYLLERSGYNPNGHHVILFQGNPRDSLDKLMATYDPYDWSSRTMHQAHIYIQENFDTLRNGEVIDIEYILGEVKVKKVSENETVKQ